MAALCFSVTIPSSYDGATLRSSFLLHRRSFLLCLQEKVQYPDTEAEGPFPLPFLSEASIIKLIILRGDDK